MRNRLFSMINIFGLALGLVSFCAIAQYVSFQLSFDQYHAGKEQIYRVAYERRLNGEVKNTSAKNFIGIRSLIEQNFPGVQSTGFWPIPANNDFIFRYDGKVRTEPGEYVFADSNFLRVFPGVLVKGDPNTVLNDPHNLIISERVSRKIFGDRDPIGQPIEDIEDPGNDGPDLVVGGVMRDFPENSHLHADFLSSMGHSWDTATYYWDVPSFYTYLRLERGADVKAMETRLNTLLEKAGTEHPNMKGTYARLQPVTDIHLHSNLSDELESNGSAMLIWFLGAIGIVILVVAWINYVNLETAQFINRSREIGIRRIIGSTRSDIVAQFFARYAWLNIFSILLAGVAAYAALPWFSRLVGIPGGQLGVFQPQVWVLSLAFWIGGSVLVGIYPALRVLRINPVQSIKGISSQGNNVGLRRGLVIVQFTVSLVLIGFLLVVYQQLNFMQLTNKKIEIEKVIAIKNPMAYVDGQIENRTKFDEFATKLAQDAATGTVSTSSAIPGTEIGFTLVNEIKRHQGAPYDPTRFKLLFIDYNYLPLYKLRLLAGRNYSPENGMEENKDHIMLNESAIHALGFESPEQAVGQGVYFPLWPWMKPETEIIGVVEDYHHEAIKRPVMPMIFFLNNASFQQVFYSVKLNAGSDPQLAVQRIEKTWHEVFPERPFHYFFMDDYYDQQFKSEKQFTQIFGIFSGIAIALACLGILGMTIFHANTRVKEISIRKVLGASVQSVILLLSKDYVRVIAISAAVAWPLIYFAADFWLKDYPVRTTMSAIVFTLPMLVLILIVVMSSFVQTLKAAQANPVDHLRSE